MAVNEVFVYNGSPKNDFGTRSTWMADFLRLTYICSNFQHFQMVANCIFLEFYHYY